MIRQPSEVYRPRIPPKYARQVDEPEWMRKGLVLHLPMQENAGSNTYDASRCGNDGALTGCKWVEKGVEFNGSSDYIDCGNPITEVSKNECHTVSMLVNATADDTVNGRIIFANTVATDNRIGILFRDGLIRVGIYDGSYNSCSGAISLNNWYHICYTYDTTTIILYINGITQTGVELPYLVSGSRITIGCAIDKTQRFFDGSISDVRIYNRALSAAEIEAMYYRSYHTYNPMRGRSVCASPTFVRRNPTMAGGMI